MNRHVLAAILWCLGLFFVNVSPVFAQATTGEITGPIEDAAGAVVPGATVSAENVDTGFARSTQSGAEGDYLITLVPRGATPFQPSCRASSARSAKACW